MMADDTIGLLDRLGIEKAHVAGFSMGGAIAQEIAINYPDRVIGLVLHATWPTSDPYFARTFELLKMLVSGHDEVRQVYQDLLLFTPAYYNANQDKIRQMHDEKASSETPTPSHAFCRQADACVMHDTLDRLHLIQAPTLITVGDRDIWTSLRFAEVLHAKIPGSRLIVEEGVSHLSFREDPGRFSEMTLSFLRQLWVGPCRCGSELK
jgi:pimeloyl-ACP methyl ester carboxylesterase